MKRRVMIAAGVLLRGTAMASKPTRLDAHDRLGELAREVESFRSETKRLPSSLDGLGEVVSLDTERLLSDPWGNPVYYLRVAGGYWLMSWGADGAPGGEGDAADLVYIAK